MSTEITSLATEALAEIGGDDDAPETSETRTAQPPPTEAEAGEGQPEPGAEDAEDDDGLITIEIAGDNDDNAEPVKLRKGEYRKMLRALGLPDDAKPDDLKGAVMMRRDYSRKTQELSQERREVRQERGQIAQERQAIQQWLGTLKREPDTMLRELERVLGEGVVQEALDQRIEQLVELENLPADQRRARELDERERRLQEQETRAQQRARQEQEARVAAYWQGKYQEWAGETFEEVGLPATQANWARVQAALQPVFQTGQAMTRELFADAVQQAAEEWRAEQNGHLSSLGVEQLMAQLGEDKVKALLAHEGAKAAAAAKARQRPVSNGSSGRSAAPTVRLPDAETADDFFTQLGRFSDA